MRRRQRGAEAETRGVSQEVEDVAEVGPVAVDEEHAIVVRGEVEAAGELGREEIVWHRRQGLQRRVEALAADEGPEYVARRVIV